MTGIRDMLFGSRSEDAAAQGEKEPGPRYIKPEELTLDPDNVNKGTERGRGLLDKSLEAYGAGRSILADAEGVVRAGNKTLEAAVAKGLRLRLIETKGDELVVVKRTDLKGDAARMLALADNRVQQVDFDPDAEVLARMLAEELPVADFYLDEELGRILKHTAAEVRRKGEGKGEGSSAGENVVELRYSAEEFAEFQTLAGPLAKEFGTDDAGVVVLRALRLATERKGGE